MREVLLDLDPYLIARTVLDQCPTKLSTTCSTP